MKHLVLYLALVVGLFAQSTKVGGSGSTRVGGSGTTRVTGAVAAGISIDNDWKNKTSSGSTLAVTVSILSGKDVVVAVATGAASYTIADNLGSTYTAVPTNSAFGQILGFSFLNNAGGTITTVTITPATTSAVQCFVFECSNLSAYTTGERGGTFFAGTASWASTTVTTATPASIVFHMASASTGNNTTTFSGWTNSFASFSVDSWYGTGSSDYATDVSYRIVSSTGSYSSTVTSSVSSNGNSLIAAFH